MGQKPNRVDAAIGARIRAQRKTMDLSLMELAAAIGLAYQQVQKYDKGVNRVSGSRLIQIAKALKVPPSFLIGENGGKVVGNSDFELLAERGAIDMLRVFVKLPKPLRLTVIKMIEQMVAEL